MQHNTKMVMLHSENKVDQPAHQRSLINITGIRYLDHNSVILSSQLQASIMNNVAKMDVRHFVKSIFHLKYFRRNSILSNVNIVER